RTMNGVFTRLGPRNDTLDDLASRILSPARVPRKLLPRAARKRYSLLAEAFIYGQAYSYRSPGNYRARKGRRRGTARSVAEFGVAGISQQRSQGEKRFSYRSERRDHAATRRVAKPGLYHRRRETRDRRHQSRPDAFMPRRRSPLAQSRR